MNLIQDINKNNLDQSVEVKILDLKKNRSLIAKKDFAKNEVIFMEKPLASSQFAWNQFYNYKACEYCMQPLETVEENVRRLTEDPSIKLPYVNECCATKKELHTQCPYCKIEYCSNECRQAAFDTYHQALCLGENRLNQNHPYNILMDVWRQIHLPPETTSIEIILKMIATMKQSSSKDLANKLTNFECSLVNEKDQIPHKLLNEKYFMELESLRQVMLEYFNNNLYVKECEPWLTEQGFRHLFSLIGRNSQGIGTSPLSVWVENCSNLTSINKSEKKKLDKLIDKIYEKLEKTSESFLNSEGAGLYETQSMINHSCNPNAEIMFKNNNNILTLVALENIKENQEIFISYLDECELHRSRHSRQKYLKENYLFLCECDRCISELSQPDITSDEDNDEDLEEEEEDDECEDSDEENKMN